MFVAQFKVLMWHLHEEAEEKLARRQSEELIPSRDSSRALRYDVQPQWQLTRSSVPTHTASASSRLQVSRPQQHIFASINIGCAMNALSTYVSGEKCPKEASGPTLNQVTYTSTGYSSQF
jgi:hypothetical protein